jgi:UDPglucose 6-dehydrogenase
MERICMVGTGYVGLVTGTCLADFGNQVICVDTDASKIEMLNNGQLPFYEFSLLELVQRNVREGRLKFSTDVAGAMRKSKVIFSGVGTPQGADGRADLSYVWAVARTVAENLNGYKVFVQKSTVPVGTGANVEKIINKYRKGNQAFDVVSNPEFLREGSAVEDFMRPDRVVFGTRSKKAATVMTEIYRPLYLSETPMVKTTVETAELIKYAANAFLATKISYINEMSQLCELVGADIKIVAKGMGLDNRVGPKFLHAGAGYGGSCFPKDTNALASFSKDAGYRYAIVESAIAANKAQRREMLDRAMEILGSPRGKKVAVLGLSFKPETDDVRESFALSLIPKLQKLGIKVNAFDPVSMEVSKPILKKTNFCDNAYAAAKGADLLVIATEWNEFRMLDMRKLMKLMRKPCLLDCRNIYDPWQMEKIGFSYRGVGRGVYLKEKKDAKKAAKKTVKKATRKTTKKVARKSTAKKTSPKARK